MRQGTRAASLLPTSGTRDRAVSVGATIVRVRLEEKQTFLPSPVTRIFQAALHADHSPRSDV